jgi:hypothetical protein
MNTEIWCSRLGVGRNTDELALRKYYSFEINEVKAGSNLAESSKEGCGSKRAVFPMMIMMIMMNI